MSLTRCRELCTNVKNKHKTTVTIIIIHVSTRPSRLRRVNGHSSSRLTDPDLEPRQRMNDRVLSTIRL